MSYIPLYITPEQRANLEKLASYLETHGDALNFEMSFYHGASPSHAVAKHTCGSAACAIGHGPAAGIIPTVFEVDDRLSWDNYARRYLGTEVTSYGMAHGHLWEWCFTSEWDEIDNTPSGAAKRIRIALDKGVPEEYFAILDGTTPVPYKV